mmetsp:Transcript_2032/g.1998  ORF Transcript_2032/g.1998 Transcript_2032/m.1998 type:complete len:101 (-) Transcript_2032:266-568(-)
MFSTIRKTISKLPLNQINKSFLSSSSSSSATILLQNSSATVASSSQEITRNVGVYSIMLGIGGCLFFGSTFSVYYFISAPEMSYLRGTQRKLLQRQIGDE